jgi:hypothetical protein
MPRIQVLKGGIQGPSGPRGLPGAGAALQVDFAYGDATPVTLTTLLAGQTLFLTACSITEIFNGVGAALTVGTDSDHGLLIGSGVIDVVSVATYQSHQILKAEADTAIKLFITPGSNASTGSGFIHLYIT